MIHRDSLNIEIASLFNLITVTIVLAIVLFLAFVPFSRSPSSPIGIVQMFAYLCSP
jgi:hypothetical protein